MLGQAAFAIPMIQVLKEQLVYPDAFRAIKTPVPERKSWSIKVLARPDSIADSGCLHRRVSPGWMTRSRNKDNVG